MEKTDIGYIRAPNFVGAIHPNSFKKIRVDFMLRPTDACPQPGIEGLSSHELHQPSYPLVIDLIPLGSQPGRHLRYSVKRCPGKLLINQIHQKKIVTSIGAGLVIIG